LAWAGWKGAFPGLSQTAPPEGLNAKPVAKSGVIAALPPTVTRVDQLPVPPSPVPAAPSKELSGLASITAQPSAVSSLASTPVVPSYIPSSAPPPSSLPSPSAPTMGKPIANAQAQEMVSQAREARRQGNMMSALESLRAADLREPGHPEILTEMALTYELMKLSDRAESSWRAVLALGETVGGSYYNLAKSRLDGMNQTAKVAPISEMKPLTIGLCQVRRDPRITKGERLTLTIPVLSTPGATIDPSQVDLHVYFYDKLADGSLATTRADPPTMGWTPAIPDWKNGEAYVDVVYNMPELKPDELRNLGKRSYGGYKIELFYQNQSMGVKAEPKDLLEFRPKGTGPAGMDNALFPKN